MRTTGLLSLLLLSPLALVAAQGGFEALAAEAAHARESNQSEEAISLYRKALELRPQWGEGWWSLGTLLYDRDDYDAAAAALKNAVRLSPRSGIASVMLGLAEAKLGRDREALQHIQAGRKLGIGDNPGVRRVMLYTEGSLLLSTGDFGAAQETLGLLARDGVEQEELTLALGMAVLGLKPADLTASDAMTRDVTLRAGRAESIAARGDLRKARSEYAELATAAPKFHNVQFAYGRFMVADHDNDKAVDAFKREIENTPNHLLARLGIAGLKIVMDPAGGLPYAEQAVRLAPNLAEAHYLLGVLLLDTGSAARAVHELELAARLGPTESKIHFALARAYTATHRTADAARARATFTRLNQEQQDNR